MFLNKDSEHKIIKQNSSREEGGKYFIVILFLMVFIASSNKGDIVSTNYLLLFPVSNEQRVLVLCINTSRDLYRLSRRSGWRTATLLLTWQGCSYFFLSFAGAPNTRPQHQTFLLWFFFFSPWCFSHVQAVSCIRAQSWGSAELFQTSSSSLANLSSPVTNYGVEIHLWQWVAKVQM